MKQINFRYGANNFIEVEMKGIYGVKNYFNTLYFPDASIAYIIELAIKALWAGAKDEQVACFDTTKILRECLSAGLAKDKV